MANDLGPDRMILTGRPRRWFAVTVGVIVVAVIATALARQLGTRDLPYAKILLATASVTDSVVDNLLAQGLWSETRGHGEGTLPPEARAVRLGAAIAELELRNRRSDSSALASIEGVVQALNTFPRGDDAATAYRSLRIPADDSALRSAARMAERAGGQRAVRLGAWLQSARFAAAIGDSSAFDPAVVKYAGSVAITLDARPEIEVAVRQFGDIAGERPHNWTALSTAVEELLRLLGTR